MGMMLLTHPGVSGLQSMKQWLMLEGGQILCIWPRSLGVWAFSFFSLLCYLSFQSEIVSCKFNQKTQVSKDYASTVFRKNEAFVTLSQDPLFFHLSNIIACNINLGTKDRIKT